MKTKYVFCLFTCTLFFYQSLLGGELKSEEEKTFQMKSGGSITIIGDEGTIKISSWDKQEVYLKITKRVWDRNSRRAEEIMENLEVEIEHSDNRLYIREIDVHEHFRFSNIFHSDKWRRHSEHQVDYDLKVPREINLKIENDEGNVEISEITGSLRLRLDEGDVILKNLESSKIDVVVDEGDLVCKNARGASSTLFVNIDEGSVRLSDCEFATIDLESDEGDFILNGLVIKNGDLQSDEGDIEADFSLLADGRCKMRTDEGDIFILVPEDFNAQLRFQAREGRIRTDFPVSVKRWGDEGEKLDDVLGEGSARLSVSTEEGNITLKKN